MLFQKRTKRVRLSNVAISARAGLIPACDDLADEAEARLNHAVHLVRTMRRVAPYTSRANQGYVLTEILADLKHYCATKGLSSENSMLLRNRAMTSGRYRT